MGFLTLFLIDLMARSRGLFRGNAARKAMRPIIDGLGATHPKFLAQNGDSGRGIDNSTPWYRIYLTVDLVPDPEETITAVARNAGYQFEINRRYIENLSRSWRGSVNPEWTYLVGKRDGRTLSVTIARDGTVDVHGYGENITYGTKVSPPAGKAIVSLSMSLPSL